MFEEFMFEEFSDAYIDANKNVCALNAIRAKLFYNTSIEEHLNKYKEYLKAYIPNVEREKMYEETKAIVRDCKTVKGFKNICKKEMKSFVSPHFSNVRDYIKYSFGEEYTAEEIVRIICSEI